MPNKCSSSRGLGDRIRFPAHTVSRMTAMRKTWVLVIAAVLSVGAPTASAQLGWAVDNAGEIVNTGNGGGTWATQSSGWGQLYGVSFVDANNGWAVGGSGTIVHTSNGGVTWTPQTSGTSDDLSGVTFVDANNGWAVGDFGTIVHTSNGGVTWASQTSNAGGENLYGVSFVDPNNGWAVGEFGTIVHTSNGGVTWTPQTSGTGLDLYGVSFLDPNNGWAVGYAAGINNNGTIVHTSNGGVTWTAQTSPTEPHTYNLYSVSFVDANNGWAVGGLNYAYIVHTSDGGVTWTTQTNPDVFDTFRGVSFVDANNGWAVGDAGTIVHTSDGGVTWTAQSSGTIYDLQSVSFARMTPATFQVRYVTHLDIGDSMINITNDGLYSSNYGETSGMATGNGNMCIGVYAFDPNEELQSCCSCLVTPDGLASLSAKAINAASLTGENPTSLVIKLLSWATTAGASSTATPGTPAPPTSSACNAGSPGPAGPTAGMHAWGTSLHPLPATGYSTTETPFSKAILSTAEFLHITQFCQYQPDQRLR